MSLKIGDIVTAPDGWDDKNNERPKLIGEIVELYGRHKMPIVRFFGGDTMCCTAKSLTKVVK